MALSSCPSALRTEVNVLLLVDGIQYLSACHSNSSLGILNVLDAMSIRRVAFCSGFISRLASFSASILSILVGSLTSPSVTMLSGVTFHCSKNPSFGARPFSVSIPVMSPSFASPDWNAAPTVPFWVSNPNLSFSKSFFAIAHSAGDISTCNPCGSCCCSGVEMDSRVPRSFCSGVSSTCSGTSSWSSGTSTSGCEIG